MGIKFVICSGANHLGMTPTIDIQSKRFTNGEYSVKINQVKKCSLLNQDVFIIQGFADPNNHLIELLITVNALKLHDCRSITAIIPYFPYGRQDKRHEKGTPISAKVICDILVAAGVNRIVSFDLHADQIQAFPSIPFFNLKMDRFFSKRITTHFPTFGNSTWKFVPADIGSSKRTAKFAKLNNSTQICNINKFRVEDQKVDRMELMGTIDGYNAVIYDDMIDTGGTLSKAYDLLKENGAKRVIAIATHPVMSDSEKVKTCLDKMTIFTTNSCDRIYTPAKTMVFEIDILLLSIMHNLTKGLDLDYIEV